MSDKKTEMTIPDGDATGRASRGVPLADVQGSSALRSIMVAATVLLAVGILAGGYVRYKQNARAALLARCKTLQADKNWKELREAAEEFCTADPSSADPWVFKAVACEESLDLEAMVASIDRIPDTDKRFVDFSVRKAIAEFKQLNRPWDGLKTCDRILDINPLITMAHTEAIDFCLLTLQQTEMTKRIRRAIRCHRERPEDYVYLASIGWLHHPSMFAANTHWLQSDPSSELFQVSRAIPVYYSNAKSSDQAERFVDVPPHTELLSRYPQNRELLNYLIHTKIEDGDVAGVRAALEKLPKTPETDRDVRVWRARAWCEDADGNLTAAREHLQKAYQCDPYFWKVHYELYDLHRRLGNQKLADHYQQLYDVGQKLAGGLSIVLKYVNQNYQDQEMNLNNSKFLAPIRDIAAMIGDPEVASAIQARLNQMP